MARMFRNVASIALAVSLVSIVLAVPDVATAYSPHDPIVINGDNGFVAANGVTGGKGTASDPYVIEGWQIVASSSPAIYIRSTTSHFVVRDVQIQGMNYMPGGSMGIWLERVSNGVLDAVDVYDCWTGIMVRVSSGVVVEKCVVHDNAQGIRVVYGGDVVVRENTVSNNLFQGINAASTDRCHIIGNMMTNNGGGITLQTSIGAVVSGNICSNDGVTISGNKLSEFDSHTITTDNLVGGLPIYYYVGAQALNLENVAAGEVILAGCENVAITGLTTTSSSVGVEIAFSESVFLTGCSFQDCRFGVLATESYFVDIRSCTFTDNEYGGILELSDFVTVYECQFAGNSVGLSVGWLTDLLVGSSDFTNNGDALDITECSHVIVSGNHVWFNEQGINLVDCSKTWIYRNDISYNNNEYGYCIAMQIWGGKKVMIEENNFIGNDRQVAIVSRGDIAWDSEYSIGNYWSDYTGIDVNGDGVGDTPYVIDANNQDYFPRMSPLVV